MQALEETPTFATMFAAVFGVTSGSDLQIIELDGPAEAETAEAAKADPAPEPAMPAEEPARTLTVGEYYRGIWQRYCAAVDIWAATVNRIYEDEREVLMAAARGTAQAMDVLPEFKVSDMKEKAAAGIRSTLVFAAQKVFAPPGVSLSIDPSDVREKFPTDEAHLGAFDPAAIWTHLEATYGGDAGKRLAWAQVASAFKSHFLGRRNETEEVRVKGGYVVLELGVWLDSIDKKFSNKIRLSHGSRTTVWQSCNAIAEIATWAERDQLSRQVERFGSDMDHYDVDIVSRQQFPLGENGELVVVTYQNKFEFKFRQDFAEQLQVFLGTYGDD